VEGDPAETEGALRPGGLDRLGELSVKARAEVHAVSLGPV
jgi:hypothetical protein